MDHHLPQQQQYGDPYRTLVPSPQPDHHPHALQYHQQQPQQTLMSPPQPQPTLMSPPQPQPQPMLMSPPQQHHASLASHFHLLHLVTKLADAIGTGTRDPNFDSLVEELTSQFARCQQLLNSISGTISSKSTTTYSSTCLRPLVRADLVLYGPHNNAPRSRKQRQSTWESSTADETTIKEKKRKE
ncbi:hypothetical protein EJB05_15559 [Eragrostis curvula]|uniref:Mediator complex subunit 9 n=1 Tax=Eragrostis curvula TaxID=38414 RepID=A0A5J9VEE5_9POAL|nr:hypothetical protein EJB05_15559 [Eragrostis curvula]